MQEPTRIISNSKPRVLEFLGNGKWYYNYDIQSHEETITNEDGIAKLATIYSFVQLKITGKPNYKNCVKLLIREYITQEQEFDLINSYNRALSGLLSQEEKEQETKKYREYLDKVAEIKSKVRGDLEQ